MGAVGEGPWRVDLQSYYCLCVYYLNFCDLLVTYVVDLWHSTVFESLYIVFLVFLYDSEVAAQCIENLCVYMDHSCVDFLCFLYGLQLVPIYFF